MDHFSDAYIEEIFSYEKPRLESTGSQSNTQKDVDYATFLKRKFAPNPQEPNRASLQTRSGTKSYAEAIREPPMKRVLN